MFRIRFGAKEEGTGEEGKTERNWKGKEEEGKRDNIPHIYIYKQRPSILKGEKGEEGVEGERKWRSRGRTEY